jgi:hypothetical protein
VILLPTPATGSSSSLSFETQALTAGCVRTIGGQPEIGERERHLDLRLEDSPILPSLPMIKSLERRKRPLRHVPITSAPEVAKGSPYARGDVAHCPLILVIDAD